MLELGYFLFGFTILFILVVAYFGKRVDAIEKRVKKNEETLRSIKVNY